MDIKTEGRRNHPFCFYNNHFFVFSHSLMMSQSGSPLRIKAKYFISASECTASPFSILASVCWGTPVSWLTLYTVNRHFIRQFFSMAAIAMIL